jgi:hypothetical protein
MSRRTINEQTTLPELAALVSEALEKAGITATLSGGAAVSIYSDNRYVSEDLDFVTIALVDELKGALAPLGFQHKGKPRLSVFEHQRDRIDWETLSLWVRREGLVEDKEVIEFFSQAGKKLPQ